MSKKVLVADDSQTIQKVIKITFANQDFDITPVLDESELFSTNGDFDLVLLDFGLTDDGYKLGQKAREKFPKTPIVALLGTFDIVEEEKLHKCGYTDKVVKPFETEKFISLCIDLIENEASEYVSSFNEEETSGEDEFSGWDVSSSAAQDDDDKTVEFDLNDKKDFLPEDENEFIDESNNLESELDGWGFDPTNLQGSDVTREFETMPPVIETLPEENFEGPVAPSPLDVSSFVGNLDDEMEDDFEIPQEHPVYVEDDSASFEEISDDNLWDADEVSSDTFSSSEEDEHEIDISAGPQMNDDFSFSNEATGVVSKSAHKNQSIDIDELKADLRNEIAPVIEKYAKEYCEQNIEKIIWEIVPDLAENLIKKELKNISKQVLTSISE